MLKTLLVLVVLLVCASAINLKSVKHKATKHSKVLKKNTKALNCAAVSCPDDTWDLMKLLKDMDGDSREIFIGCCDGTDPTEPPEPSVGPLEPDYHNDNNSQEFQRCPHCPCKDDDCGVINDAPAPKRILNDPLFGPPPNDH